MAKSPGKKKEKSKGPKKGASEKKAKGPSKSKDDKKKKGKKEKKGPLSKKDMDIAKLQKQKEEQEALQREAEEKAAAEKKLAIELKERDGQLAQSSAIIESYNRWVVAKVTRMKSLQEWKAFRACRNIPDFNKLYEVNSYISYWLSQLSPPAMKRLLKLTPEYLQLLYELQFYLIDPEISMRPDLLKELGILYRGMIDNQITYVNKCTYNIIADLSVLYEPEVGICDYLLSIPDITHCLWGNIYCAPNINGHEFEELKFKFKIPEVLLSTPGIYRLIKSEYDHYSDSCLSYFPPGVENALKQSILDWVELHKLASGEYTELQSPAELKKKKRKDKKKKKGKGGKKRAKSPKGPKEKKGKKKRKSKERSGSEDTGAATTGDEDDFKLISERESSATVKSKKKKSKKKAKGEGKDKSGTKKGKKNRGQDNADTDTSANTTTEPESEAEEEEESFSMSSFMAKARKTLTEITRRQSVRPDRTSLEERTSIEEREQEEQLKLKLEESYKKAVKGSKKKQKKKKKKSRDSEVSESEGNEEEEAEDVEKIESGNAGEVTSSTADDGNTTTAPESDDKKPTISEQDNRNVDSKPGKAEKANDTEKKAEETVTVEKGEGRSSKKNSTGSEKKGVQISDTDDSQTGKQKSKPDKKQSKEKAKGEKPKKEKDKSKKSKSKKGAKSSKTKSSKSKTAKSAKSKSPNKKSKGKDKQKKEKAKPVDKSAKPAKSEKLASDKQANKKQQKSEDLKKNAKSAKVDKPDGKKEDAKELKKNAKEKKKADVSTSESRSASKEKKPKGSSKPGSAKSDKSVSKSKSDSGRSKSKSPKGDDRKSRSKTKDKSGKGKGKSKSKSRSKSGGSKKSKKKGGKSKSKDRHKKTEAELAKERERAEKSKFIPQLQENELNLRNYVILGGVYQFNLLEIPPQPKNRGNWVIHIKEADNSLKEVAFEADYTPPAIADQESAKKTPEEMEREAKQQEEELQKLVLADMSNAGMGQQDFDLPKDPEEEAYLAQKMLEEAERKLLEAAELQYKGLMSVQITAPKVALWFEPPTPVSWDPVKRAWSTEGFYDIKFNESTLQLSFRTVRFGTFAFGHNRWSNLPYQSWELRPIGRDKMCFSLIAAIAVIEFIVMGDLICISSLSNVANSSEVEASLINKYMKPHILIKAMRHHGLDLFPEFDSYAYVDGVLVKDVAAEDHLYQCMAVVSSAFNFQWSRWNLLAGRDRMVYQMRQRLHGSASPGNYSMVLTTPTKSIRIDCTEVSPNYTEDPVMEFEYYADLVNLVKGIATDAGIKIINQSSPHYVETVRILLSSVRPLSFS